MKKNKKVIEAWRNEEYFLGLSEEERAALPAHPSGPTKGIEDEVLSSITGGCAGSTSAMCSPCGIYHCY